MLVNVISTMFKVIHKREYAKFYIFERRKAAKSGSLQDFMSGK